MTLEVKQCIQNEAASLSNAISSLNCNDDDETLTCSKSASPAQTKKFKYQQLCMQLELMVAEFGGKGDYCPLHIIGV